MNKKTIIWIAIAVVGVIALGAAGFVGYRIYNRSQARFPGGPGRGFGNQFRGEGERAFGEVISFGDDTLTIVNQDGEQLSFVVSADTQFFSQESSLNGLQDPEVGQEVSIIYETQPDGSLLALIIADFQRPNGFRNSEAQDNN